MDSKCALNPQIESLANRINVCAPISIRRRWSDFPKALDLTLGKMFPVSPGRFLLKSLVKAAPFYM